MTDYQSATYRKPFVPVVPGDLHEFRLDEAYVLSQELPAHTSVLDFIRPDPLPTDTASWGLSYTGVMEAFSETPQSHRKRRKRGPGVPVWTLVCLFAGMALIGLSLSLHFMILPVLGVLP